MIHNEPCWESETGKREKQASKQQASNKKEEKKVDGKENRVIMKQRKGEKRETMGRIVAVSFERYNGGKSIERKFGSSTVTKFYVYREEYESDPSQWKVVEGFGPTPGDRKTFAIRRYQETIWT